MTESCPHCRLPAYTSSLDELPRCVRPLTEHQDYAGHGIIARVASTLYFCQACGTFWYYRYDPRSDCYFDEVVPLAVVQIFFRPALEYDDVLDLIAAVPADGSVLEIVRQVNYQMPVDPTRAVANVMERLGAGTRSYRELELLLECVFSQIWRVLSDARGEEPMPPVETPKEEIDRMVLALLARSLEKTEVPVLALANRERARLRLKKGLRPIHDAVMDPANFADAPPDAERRIRTSTLQGLAHIVEQLSSPDIDTPAVWMPDRESRWLIQHYARFRDGKSAGRQWLRMFGGAGIAYSVCMVVVAGFVALLSGMIYSQTMGPRGGFAGVVPVAVVQGVLVFLGLRWVRLNARAVPLLLLVLGWLSLGPVLIGHLLRYAEAPSLAYTQVQADIQGPYPDSMKILSADELFPHFVEFHTGRAGSGFIDYLRLYAAQGFEGYEAGFRYRHGGEVWFMWFIHMILFGFATLVGLAPGVNRTLRD